MSRLGVPARNTHMTAIRAVGLIAAIMLSALIDVPSAGAVPCPDVEIVFARGTTEPPGVGGIGQAFVDSLRSRLGDRSVGVYAVNYPASRDFAASTRAGAGASRARAVCSSRLPRHPHGARWLLPRRRRDGCATAAMPPTVAPNVAAVALFGGPRSSFADRLSPGPLPRSERTTSPRPSTCASPTTRSASKAAAIWARTPHMSRRDWLTKLRSSLQAGSDYRSDAPHLVGLRRT